METNDAERLVVARPVASRPLSNFRSLSDLIDDAINASPPASTTQTTVPIRPKIARFTSSINHFPDENSPYMDGDPASAIHNTCDKSCVKTLQSDSSSTVIYKPRAKVVSRSTDFSVNPGNISISHLKLTEGQIHVQCLEKREQQYQTPLISITDEVKQPQSNTCQTMELPKYSPLRVEQDLKGQQSLNNSDQNSYDGYNWRKYGQKQVKGSESPRSYYKCTHPNCTVKKKIERSLDGRIEGIIYRGEHNHPNLSKHFPSCSQAASDGYLRDDSQQLIGLFMEKYDVSANASEAGCSMTDTCTGKALLFYDPMAATTYNSQISTSDACRFSGDSEEESSENGGARKPNCKRRSYYKCTSPKCHVRKHVERVADDPYSVVTTYEGKHNHDVPTRNLNPYGSDPSPQAPTMKGPDALKYQQGRPWKGIASVMTPPDLYPDGYNSSTRAPSFPPRRSRASSVTSRESF